MSYLSFNKKELVNLEYSLQKEILGTDRSGGYASTTIVCCNTRKYHGLLVLPIENFQGRNHVLLSSLDETIIQHGRDFNFGVHKYPGTYEPRGHKYVVDFSYDKCPKITYQVGGVVLTKEILLSHNERQVLIRYTLVDAHSPTKLQLRPFLAFRDAHNLSKENSNANLGHGLVENGVQFNMYKGFPDLNIQFNKEMDFHSNPVWHKNIRYEEERKRGYEFEEDLFVPGYFETTIKKGESIIFSASTEEIAPKGLKRKFTTLVNKRADRNSFEECLKYSASQFVINKLDETRIKSGYHWLLSHSRDTFIALPGIAIGNNDLETFEKVLKSIQKYFTNGLFEKTNSTHSTPEYESDTSLWFFWTLQQYEKFSGKSKKEIWKTYGKILKEILETYKQGRHEHINMSENGLIWTQGYDFPLHWMKTIVNGVPSVMRNGFLVEINALWYNAVKYAVALASEASDKEFFQDWEELSLKIDDSFKHIFWNEDYGYLADYSNGTHQNMEMRPNQVFACSFDYSPISSRKRKKVLDKVTKELLTPKGLRTLTPNAKYYKGMIEGSIDDRERAIYNGVVHPWLIGAYIEAHLKLYGNNYVAEAEKIISHFEENILNYGICSISEYNDGNPPFKSHGCISSAKSVGEILRSVLLIKEYKEDKKEQL